ncbi:selenocysteine lyase/cysteine desulfurase [Neolewinella xylanilytica]|uniref:Selenocysteine lyase/cysteine desulfurase n=1 Tax=Neolewinella xylanilytica TaxID=1514080 RepID=A0A2S6I1T8_9BACT|nr:aminotransferase class V-fold PLP-dependent enzyme [Neolewinella xylanilytica]PPK85049.1 selenocysteine lyase/cysteine desulfurase [Neolewinella xylanilytica]
MFSSYSPGATTDLSDIRRGIIGQDYRLVTHCHPGGIPLLYADWTATGRAYAPIESTIREKILPLMANTHTDTNSTGSAMTYAYESARRVIRHHVNAGTEDLLVCTGSGMTAAVNKLQRLIGCKRDFSACPERRPLVFISHMEHHSNHTSWLETGAEVVLVDCDATGLVCARRFAEAVAEFPAQRPKYAAVTACSNVTGIESPYREIAEVMHAAGGYCFVDFACSAPYVDIDMHPTDRPEASLDAIYFSPHKFLGGPGSCGVLVVHRRHLASDVPDHPGGGTVAWTNPWGSHQYLADREAREDGGTPAILQTIRAALAVRLKDRMGTTRIRRRENHLMKMLWAGLDRIPEITVLANDHRERLGIVSFNIDGLHYNLAVKMLNDHYGVQVRGGCSCAGTYGHHLLSIDRAASDQLLDRIGRNEAVVRPGWIRLSIHPTMTGAEITYLLRAIAGVATHHSRWKHAYHYCPQTASVRCLEPAYDRGILEDMAAIFR